MIKSLIAWTRVHAIDAARSGSTISDACCVATSPAKGKTVWEHSPTRRKERKMMRINRGVNSLINCLYPLYYRTYTWRPTRAPTWPHGLPATWPCPACAGHPGAATWPQCRVATRVGPARHVTLACVPRQPPLRHHACKTPFCDIFN